VDRESEDSTSGDCPPPQGCEDAVRGELETLGAFEQALARAGRFDRDGDRAGGGEGSYAGRNQHRLKLTDVWTRELATVFGRLCVTARPLADDRRTLLTLGPT
jgi:hypothetical protein